MKKVPMMILNSLLVVFCISTPAYAHEMADGGGFLSGLSHPVLGFDHLLAMLSVGILSAQMGGRAIWTVPATFVAVMFVGGVMGMQGIPLFSVELGIAVSVFALGVTICVDKKLPALIAMLFVGFFAVFHGYAHGIEMPYLAEPALYVSGFLLGTIAIHIAGVIIGSFFGKLSQGDQKLKYLGAAIGGIGFHLIMLT